MEEYNEPINNTKEHTNPLSSKNTKYPIESVISVLEFYREHNSVSKIEFSEILESNPSAYSQLCKRDSDSSSFMSRSTVLKYASLLGIYMKTFAFLLTVKDKAKNIVQTLFDSVVVD